MCNCLRTRGDMNSVSCEIPSYQVSSPQLSFDLTLPKPNQAITHSLGQCPDGGSPATYAHGGQASHIQSTNQVHALNVFAARKHQTLSDVDEFCQQKNRTSNIHRSNSVWKEVFFLLPVIVIHRCHSQFQDQANPHHIMSFLTG